MPVLDETFNVAVRTLAPRALHTSAQFDSFAAMREDFQRKGILTVNVNHSENTIFGGPVNNWHFRAWHDAAHLALDVDFSSDGERAAAAWQIAQLFTVYGDNPTVRRWAALVDCEVNGQAAHFFRTGAFTDNQFAFTLEYVGRVYGLTPAAFPTFSASTARERHAQILAAMPRPLIDPYAQPRPTHTAARLAWDVIHSAMLAEYAI